MLALSFLSVVSAYKSELVLQDPVKIGSVVKNQRLPAVASDLPEAWDYRELGLMTQDLNQHIPVYCGSCWAHAAFSSLADRIKIGTNGTARDVIPSIQALINCGDAGTCGGGDSNAANAWVYKNSIPEVTCQQYQAKNMECTAMNTCLNCDHDPDVGCFPVPEGEYPTVKVTEYGSVKGDANIMAEIMNHGPVSCYINANCIEDYSGGVNMYDTCSDKTINHAIQINGWGVDEDGTDYWIGRNSWGTYWGERGFFRIVRGGRYDLQTCYWATPDLTGY